MNDPTEESTDEAHLRGCPWCASPVLDHSAEAARGCLAALAREQAALTEQAQ